MPKDVDRYYEEAKKQDPSMSDEKAWAISWSRFCKFKAPGSDHCKKKPSEYFKGKEAGSLVRIASTYWDKVAETEKEAALPPDFQGYLRQFLPQLNKELAEWAGKMAHGWDVEFPTATAIETKFAAKIAVQGPEGQTFLCAIDRSGARKAYGYQIATCDPKTGNMVPNKKKPLGTLNPRPDKPWGSDPQGWHGVFRHIPKALDFTALCGSPPKEEELSPDSNRWHELNEDALPADDPFWTDLEPVLFQPSKGMTLDIVGKYRAKQASGYETLETAYFHISNGGLTLSLLRDPSFPSSYKVKYELSNMGASAGGEFPLPFTAAGWLNAILLGSGQAMVDSWAAAGYSPFNGSVDMTSGGQEVHFSPADVQRMLRTAKTFSSDKALQEYLKEHPKADKSKHTVEEAGDDDDIEVTWDIGEDDSLPRALMPLKDQLKAVYHEAQEKLTEEVEKHSQEHHAKPKSWKERFGDMKDQLAKAGKGVTNWVQKESEVNPDLGKFIQNDSYRRKALMGMHKAVTEAPEKLVHKAVEVAAEEVAEFEEAGKGIKAVLSGKQMTDSQKHAFKKAAFHVGLSVAVGSVGAGAVGIGAMATASAKTFAVSFARTVAYKAVAKSMGKLNTLQEIEHLGVGIGGLMKSFLTKFAAEGKKPKAQDILGALVTAEVANALASVDASDVVVSAKEASKGKKKQASSYGEVSTLLEEMTDVEGELRNCVKHLKQDLTLGWRVEPSSRLVAFKLLSKLHQDGKIRELGLALLQDYDMPAPQRKATEEAVKLTSTGFRIKAGQAREQIIACLKKLEPLVAFFDAAHVTVQSGKKKTEGTEAGGGTKIQAGSFTVVNSGGFNKATMADVVALVKAADSALKRNGFNQVCYGPVYVTKTLKKGNVLAFYDLGTDDIFVRANFKKGKAALDTFLHEVGHRMSKKLKNDKGIENLYRMVDSQEFQVPPREPPPVGTIFRDSTNKEYKVIRVRRNEIDLESTATGRFVGTITVDVYYKVSGKKYDMANPRHLGFVSSYAKSGGPEENFAEMFSMYCMDLLPVLQSVAFEELVYGTASSTTRIAARYASTVYQVKQ